MGYGRMSRHPECRMMEGPVSLWEKRFAKGVQAAREGKSRDACRQSVRSENRLEGIEYAVLHLRCDGEVRGTRRGDA